MTSTLELLASLPMLGPKKFDEIWDRVEEGHHYGRDGEPISMRSWCRIREFAKETIRVAEDRVGPYWISTVWIGLDHGFGQTAPLIFETMVFNRETDESDLDCRRYSTEAEALWGHAQMVDEVRLIVEATS